MEHHEAAENFDYWTIERQLRYVNILEQEHIEKYGFARSSENDVFFLKSNKLREGVTDKGIDISIKDQYFIEGCPMQKLDTCLTNIEIEKEVKPFNLQIKHIQEHIKKWENKNKDKIVISLTAIVNSMKQMKNNKYLIERYEIIDSLVNMPMDLDMRDVNVICNILNEIFK